MTDLEAAAYLRELKEYNLDGTLRTPQNDKTDTFWDCALGHAVRALEERARVEGMVDYRRNPNGSFRAVLKPEYRPTVETDPS